MVLVWTTCRSPSAFLPSGCDRKLMQPHKSEGQVTLLPFSSPSARSSSPSSSPLVLHLFLRQGLSSSSV